MTTTRGGCAYSSTRRSPIRKLSISDEREQPAQAHPHHAADPEQREALEQRSLDELALVILDAFRIEHELTTARLAPMILLAVGRVSVLLDMRYSTTRTT